MVAAKTQIVGGALLGALALNADAFVVPNSPTAQVSEPSALRGAAQTFAETTPSDLNGSIGVAAVAAGVAAMGSFAGIGKRNAAARKRITRSAAAEEAPPPPPKWDKTTELGAQPPLGFWDPAGFCEDEEKFKDFRAKELKHGRLAMMGAVGMLGQSLVQVPGMEGVPKDASAITVGNGLVGGIAIFAIIGALEAVVFVQDPNKEPGNFGNPLPLLGDDYSEEMRAKELNNGRIAMFSAIGIIAASALTGKSAIAQFGL